MRITEITRKTNETDISINFNIDGKGSYQISTGIGFLDHMISHLAVHGLFDIRLHAKGDLDVDTHHTMEDCALALGQAFDKALGDRKGIVRIGSSYVPMDESLALVVIDLSGRPYSLIKTNWKTPIVGNIPTSQFDHFFESFAVTARCNIHCQTKSAIDDHHQAEALFKAFGRAIDAASILEPRRKGIIPSTKGSLA